MLSFFVPGEPIAQPRPRATVRGRHASVYNDPKHPVVAWKQLVAIAARPGIGSG